MRRLKNEYCTSVKRSQPRGDTSIEDALPELPSKKIGRPLLLGNDLDKQVREYVKYLRKRSTAVNIAVVIAAAEGNKDASLLSSNGGGICLTKDWAKNLMKRMGMVKRRVSTKAKVDVEEFETLKDQFLLSIKTIVILDEIPLDLIIN